MQAAVAAVQAAAAAAVPEVAATAVKVVAAEPVLAAAGQAPLLLVLVAGVADSPAQNHESMALHWLIGVDPKTRGNGCRPTPPAQASTAALRQHLSFSSVSSLQPTLPEQPRHLLQGIFACHGQVSYSSGHNANILIMHSDHAAIFDMDGRSPHAFRCIIMHRSLPPIAAAPVPISVLTLLAFALFGGSLPCLSLRHLNLGVSLSKDLGSTLGAGFSETPTWTFTISTTSTPSEARRVTKASNCSSHSNIARHKRSASLYPFNRSPGPSNRSCRCRRATS